MPAVLTTSSQVVCAHQGKVQVQSAEKLRVGPNKDPVLVEASIDGKKIPDCQTTPASDPSGPTALKCQKVSSVPQGGPPTPTPAITAGRSLKLRVNNHPVMLETL